MPATAGRVRMPANNRVHSSAALQTHGIWQSAIGYDPYAPDQKQPPPSAPGVDRDAQASLSAPSADQQNAYDSFQGLLALARLTGSNADEARGACRKCGRVGHLPSQCRNFLVLKDEAALAAANAAAAASDMGSHPDGGNGSLHRKDRTHSKRYHSESMSGRAISDTSSEEDESSEADESGLSDSSEDSEMERVIAARFGKNVLNSLSRRSKLTHSKEQPQRKRSHSKRSKGIRDVSSVDNASSEEDLKKTKHRSKSKRSCKEVSDSGTDEKASASESEREHRRKRRRSSHKHGNHRSKHRSNPLDESSEGERTKRSKKKGSSRRHADRKKN